MAAETKAGDVLTKADDVLIAENSQPKTKRLGESSDSSALDGQSDENTLVVPNNE